MTCFDFNSHLPEFVFNTENITESTWNLEDGYSEEDLEKEPFPARVMGAGARAGIFLVLKGQKIDYDLLCRGPVQGFKVRFLQFSNINKIYIVLYTDSFTYTGRNSTSI